MFLKIDPQCFGLFGKFQDTNEICMCFQTVFPFLVTMMSIKKKFQFIFEKEFYVNTIQVHMQQQQNKKNFIKKWHVQIEINFNGNNKREFGFCFPAYKKKVIFWYSDFLGRWEKLYHEK